MEFVLVIADDPLWFRDAALNNRRAYFQIKIGVTISVSTVAKAARGSTALKPESLLLSDPSRAADEQVFTAQLCADARFCE